MLGRKNATGRPPLEAPTARHPPNHHSRRPSPATTATSAQPGEQADPIGRGQRPGSGGRRRNGGERRRRGSEAWRKDEGDAGRKHEEIEQSPIGQKPRQLLPRQEARGRKQKPRADGSSRRNQGEAGAGENRPGTMWTAEREIVRRPEFRVTWQVRRCEKLSRFKGFKSGQRV